MYIRLHKYNEQIETKTNKKDKNNTQETTQRS